MPRLIAARFESVGHSDARLDGLVLRFGGHDNEPTDSVLWLRNGGGKSSILNLIFSVLRPSQREFLGSEADAGVRELMHYVSPDDTASVCLQWSLDGDSSFGETGQVMTGVSMQQLPGGTGLRRLYYSVLVSDGTSSSLSIDSLPLVAFKNGSRHVLRLPAIKEELEKLEGRSGVSVFTTEIQKTWAQHLTKVQLDPEVFGYQLKMNRSEGVADEIFRFSSDAAFADFVLEMVLPVETADNVSTNLSQFSEHVAEGPQLEQERDALNAAEEVLVPTVELAKQRDGERSILVEATQTIERVEQMVSTARGAREEEIREAEKAVAHQDALLRQASEHVDASECDIAVYRDLLARAAHNERETEESTVQAEVRRLEGRVGGVYSSAEILVDLHRVREELSALQGERLAALEREGRLEPQGRSSVIGALESEREKLESEVESTAHRHHEVVDCKVEAIVEARVAEVEGKALDDELGDVRSRYARLAECSALQRALEDETPDLSILGDEAILRITSRITEVSDAMLMAKLDAMDSRRALEWLESRGTLPPPIDAERVQRVLVDAGLSACTGGAFLSMSEDSDWVLDALEVHPELASGVIVEAEELDRARKVINDTDFDIASPVVVGTPDDLSKRGPARLVVLPPRAFYDRGRAADEKLRMKAIHECAMDHLERCIAERDSLERAQVELSELVERYPLAWSVQRQKHLREIHEVVNTAQDRVRSLDGEAGLLSEERTTLQARLTEVERKLFEEQQTHTENLQGQIIVFKERVGELEQKHESRLAKYGGIVLSEVETLIEEARAGQGLEPLREEEERSLDRARRSAADARSSVALAEHEARRLEERLKELSAQGREGFVTAARKRSSLWNVSRIESELEQARKCTSIAERDVRTATSHRDSASKTVGEKRDELQLIDRFAHRLVGAQRGLPDIDALKMALGDEDASVADKTAETVAIDATQPLESLDRWVDQAVTRLDTALDRYRELEQRGRQVSRGLERFASSTLADVLPEAMRDRFRERDLDVLLTQAAALLEDVRVRSGNIDAELLQVDHHRSLIATGLEYTTDRALEILRSLEQASIFPSDVPSWGGLPFLEVALRTPSTAVERKIVAERVIDRAVRQRDVPSGLRLVQSMIRELVKGGKLTIRMLKPDVHRRQDYISISSLGALSGGERLTAAILLYCTLARMRAQRRGEASAPTSVLILDNPVGACSHPRFLELQREMARSHAVQLVFTTGVEDLEALARVPNILRLRNAHTDARGRRRVTKEPLPIDVVRIARADPAPSRSSKIAA